MFHGLSSDDTMGLCSAVWAVLAPLIRGKMGVGLHRNKIQFNSAKVPTRKELFVIHKQLYKLYAR